MSGIVDFEFEFPRSSVSVKAMHEASGVSREDILEITISEEFPALGEHERSWELASKAGARLLQRSGFDLDAIHHVIYAGSGVWDVPFWSPSAKIAHELGITRAHCFEVTNFCNAAMTAVQIACEKCASGAGGYALVLVADRLSRMVDYSDPDSKDLFNFGDSGAAVLVAEGAEVFTVAHSAMRTDPSWSDAYFGEYTKDGVVIRRGAQREGLRNAYVENFLELTKETLGVLRVGLDDVAYLLINHGDRRMHELLLRELGLSHDRSVFNYDRLGHMGGADTLIALRQLMNENRLRPGDLVLLATSAMGFSWAITAIVYMPGNTDAAVNAAPSAVGQSCA